jgi:hypothetical protein
MKQRSDVENLDMQLTEKVAPYCRDKEISFLASTPGNTYIIGTDADIAQSLENIFRGLISKKVFKVHDILGILAVAQTRLEKGED